MLTVEHMEAVTEGLELLAVWVERWSEITTWPVNEVWMLLVVAASVTVLVTALLVVRGVWGFLRGAFTGPPRSRWHCHDCTMQRREANREAMRKAGDRLSRLWVWCRRVVMGGSKGP